MLPLPVFIFQWKYLARKVETRKVGRNSLNNASSNAIGLSRGKCQKEKEVNHLGGMIMRLDKYLKVSRLIKRRTVANEACDGGRVMINDKPAKASTNVKVGDVITIGFGNKEVKVEVLSIQETVRKEEAGDMFKYL